MLNTRCYGFKIFDGQPSLDLSWPKVCWKKGNPTGHDERQTQGWRKTIYSYGSMPLNRWQLTRQHFPTGAAVLAFSPPKQQRVSGCFGSPAGPRNSDNDPVGGLNPYETINQPTIPNTAEKSINIVYILNILKLIIGIVDFQCWRSLNQSKYGLNHQPLIRSLPQGQIFLSSLADWRILLVSSPTNWETTSSTHFSMRLSLPAAMFGSENLVILIIMWKKMWMMENWWKLKGFQTNRKQNRKIRRDNAQGIQQWMNYMAFTNTRRTRTHTHTRTSVIYPKYKQTTVKENQPTNQTNEQTNIFSGHDWIGACRCIHRSTSRQITYDHHDTMTYR